MPEVKPPAGWEEIPLARLYILQGDDELSVKDAVQAIAARLRAGAPNELEVERLDARGVERKTIQQSLNSLSLFSPLRMLVLENAIEALGGKEGRAWLEETLASMPESVVLALLITDSQRYRNGQMEWETVGPKHWLRQSAAQSGLTLAWLEYPQPNMRAMPGWIAAEALRQGGSFEGQAAAELANLVGNNLFQARHEIRKALDYAGPGVNVNREDVRLLCSQSREEDIFAMLDALGLRDGRTALGLLQRLQQDLPPQYIFSMLARQVRLLIMARETLDAGGSAEELITRTHLNPFVAKKAFTQCRKFGLPELEALYRSLDRMDEDSKIGHATLGVAMQSLIARACLNR